VINIAPADVTTAYEWYRRRETLSFDPPYQRRGGLWDKRTRAFLIDSILNGFDVPKFYVADLRFLSKWAGPSSKTHAIIDGKQRFETLFEWFDGDLVLNSDCVLYDDPLLDITRLNSDGLRERAPELAVRVEEFRLAVMNVVTDEQDLVDQLFIRLNTSRPLTGAETRNAMEGEAPAVIRAIAEHEFFTTRVRFSVARGGDLNSAAKLLILEFTGDFVDVKRRPLDEFVRVIANEGERALSTPAGLVAAGDRARVVLSEMCEVFRPRDPLLRSEGQTPVYYWLVRSLGYRPDLRDFLERFESARAHNRRLRSELDRQDAGDQELAHYDQLSRSVNDRLSLAGRFEILRRRYTSSEGGDVASETQPEPPPPVSVLPRPVAFVVTGDTSDSRRVGHAFENHVRSLFANADWALHETTSRSALDFYATAGEVTVAVEAKLRRRFTDSEAEKLIARTRAMRSSGEVGTQTLVVLAVNAGAIAGRTRDRLAEVGAIEAWEIPVEGW
jgi:hypothetical protein